MNSHIANTGPIDSLDRIMAKYHLTIVEYFATVEVENSDYKKIITCPVTNWDGTVTELREHLVKGLEKIGYKL